jgi:hypothetical protein
MVISNVVLSRLIEKEYTDKARISQKAFFVRVSKWYCPAMTKNGLCTRVCANCKPALLGSLEDILPRVRSVEAVVTWRLRGAVSIQMEKRSKAEKSPIVTRDEHGIRVAETGIDGLSAMFGVL